MIINELIEKLDYYNFSSDQELEFLRKFNFGQTMDQLGMVEDSTPTAIEQISAVPTHSKVDGYLAALTTVAPITGMTARVGLAAGRNALKFGKMVKNVVARQPKGYTIGATVTKTPANSAIRPTAGTQPVQQPKPTVAPQQPQHREVTKEPVFKPENINPNRSYIVTHVNGKTFLVKHKSGFDNNKAAYDVLHTDKNLRDGNYSVVLGREILPPKEIPRLQQVNHSRVQVDPTVYYIRYKGQGNQPLRINLPKIRNKDEAQRAISDINTFLHTNKSPYSLEIQKGSEIPVAEWNTIMKEIPKPGNILRTLGLVAR